MNDKIIHAVVVILLIGPGPGLPVQALSGNPLAHGPRLAISDEVAALVDFNGDGYADLAVGAPFDTIDGVESAGAVNVVYGSASGLSAAGDQLWHQNSPDVEGVADPFEEFGYALARGDFNDDGFTDLAVGVTDETVDGKLGAGAVNVLYGSAAGLSAAGDQLWHQNSPDVEGDANRSDFFGSALASGDFNGDGYADLAVGVPFENIDGINNAGAVNVLYGSASGLTASGDQLWSQNSQDVEGDAAFNDQLGSALASGDFDGDGNADLAVGVPYEDVDRNYGSGAVNVLYGSASGLSAAGDQLWHQNSPDVEGDASLNDNFGYSLAAANSGVSSQADLAVGVPGEIMDGNEEAGAVNVLYGSASGLSAAGDQLWSQNSPSVQGASNPSDNFGYALAAANFGKGPQADLAVGVPYENINGNVDAGAVNVLYGTAGGLSAAGDQFWHQGITDVEGVLQAGDFFGSALAAGNFGNSSQADLGVGAPGEDIDGNGSAGAVNVLYATAGGLSAAGDQFWHQNSPDVEGVAFPFDFFGNALAASR